MDVGLHTSRIKQLRIDGIWAEFACTALFLPARLNRTCASAGLAPLMCNFTQAPLSAMGVNYVFLSAYLASKDLFHRELHDGSCLSRAVVMGGCLCRERSGRRYLARARWKSWLAGLAWHWLVVVAVMAIIMSSL